MPKTGSNRERHPKCYEIVDRIASEEGIKGFEETIFAEAFYAISIEDYTSFKEAAMDVAKDIAQWKRGKQHDLAT